MSDAYVVRGGEPVLIKKVTDPPSGWKNWTNRKVMYLDPAELVSSPDTLDKSWPHQKVWTFRRDGWLISVKEHQFFSMPTALNVESNAYGNGRHKMNRLEERRLRRLISSEVDKSLKESSRPIRSLRLLFEEDGSELNKLDVAKGPTATVAWLNGPGTDPRVRALLNSGRKDGSPDDEAANISERGATLGELIPTQVEIELTKSIAFPLAKFDAMKKMISGGVQRVGPPDNDTIVISGNLIVDGHHRWSSLFSVAGPDAQIAAIDVKLPEKDAASVLSIVQTAIAATMTGGEPVPKAKAGGMNILGKGKDELSKLITSAVGQSGEVGEILSDDYVEKCLADQDVMKHFGIKEGSDVAAARSAIVEKVSDNLSKMNQPAEGSPARVDMPQLDKAQGGAKAALAKLQKGKVNYKTPFDVIKGKEKDETTEESVSRSDNIIIERWQKLAGVIKG